MMCAVTVLGKTELRRSIPRYHFIHDDCVTSLSSSWWVVCLSVWRSMEVHTVLCVSWEPVLTRRSRNIAEFDHWVNELEWTCLNDCPSNTMYWIGAQGIWHQKGFAPMSWAVKEPEMSFYLLSEISCSLMLYYFIRNSWRNYSHLMHIEYNASMLIEHTATENHCYLFK